MFFGIRLHCALVALPGFAQGLFFEFRGIPISFHVGSLRRGSSAINLEATSSLTQGGSTVAHTGIQRVPPHLPSYRPVVLTDRPEVPRSK